MRNVGTVERATAAAIDADPDGCAEKAGVRILVVDDDPEIASAVRRGLALEGYGVDTACDGRDALTKIRENEPDLIILDIMMPEIDGLEVSKRVRQVDNTPILMLTAKDSVADRVAGLDSGADDYLAKPFSFHELLARVRALLRRREPRSGVTLRFSDLSLNTATREVTRADQAIELTTLEFDLLEYFLRHPRQVLQRERIYERVWGYDYLGESNAIEVYVSYLRSKLEAGDRPRLIQTARGVGYVLRE